MGQLVQNMKYKAHNQYRTMLRAYQELERISTNNGNKISFADPDYEVRNFFIHCYHLKDSLKKDSTIALQEDVEKFITESNSLSLAADYANSFKHGELDRKTRSSKVLGKTNKHLRLDLTPTGFVGSARMELTISGEKYDAFALATECINEWNNYLARNKVLFKDQ